MKVINDYPPNINELRKHFAIGSGVVFTYGEILFNPDGGHINKALMAHEQTHSGQQAGMGVEAWWETYISDPSFRLSQEIEAYGNQLRCARDHYKNTRKTALLLHILARDLSSELYGNIIEYSEALKLIKEKSI